MLMMITILIRKRLMIKIMLVVKVIKTDISILKIDIFIIVIFLMIIIHLDEKVVC